MSHVTLIRHGQANSDARDEKSYDRLSPLGHQQAAWLGDHLRTARAHHPRVFCGTLRRHLETAQSMGMGAPITQDSRLNELEYFTLARLLEDQQGIPVPKAREEFADHFPRVLTAWRDNQLEGAPESFAHFETRVMTSLAEIAEGDGPALVVTSGGLIAMAMRQMMGLEIAAMARLGLAIMNTSVHRLYPISGQLSPVLFNAVPHLEQPDRHYAQTHL